MFKKIFETLRRRKEDIERPELWHKQYILQIVQEELAELIQAISKMNRSSWFIEKLKDLQGKTQTEKIKEQFERRIESVESLRREKFKENLCEEMADVFISLKWLMDLYNVNEDDVPGRI